MNCLILAPQRLGIREVALRVGEEWEAMGYDVAYDLPDGAAARVGPVTVGVPGIAWWWQKRFAELARDPTEYDVIWTHQPLSPTLPSRHSALWDRVLVTFHTTEHAKYRLAKEGVYPRTLVPYHWVTKQLERRFYGQLADLDAEGPQYTVVSSQLKDKVAAFGIEEATTTPNGVFTPDEKGFEPIREEYGIPDSVMLVFNIGGLNHQKRPVEFAETMAEVCSGSEDVYCVIAGDGPLREDVEQHTSENVRVTGYISDEEKWRWFADTDVFASLSAYEGLPVATLEALSFGLPVVLSDIPAHRAVIDEYDATGRCVAVDSEAVAATIKEFAGRQAEVALPSWQESAADYISLFENETKPETIPSKIGQP
jgi:glycosyltransferase involved in cell wall biosynthesis